ncbi:NAD-dependent epimerase/dehydratase family protein [Candidatus Woesearchaeota archaeon]|nr:NAD-dependent epimerase/dehydratase family protein [Candidatus Woesearchaeota archaeon]
MTNKKIVVTGAAGFIGSNLTIELCKRGYSVVALDNFSLGTQENLSFSSLSPVLHQAHHGSIHPISIIEGNITDEKKILEITKDAYAIVNIAAASASPMFSLDNIRDAVKTNVDGFLTILKAAVYNNVAKVIYASTSSIYGNNAPPLTEDMLVVPTNMYAATKLMNEYCAALFSKEHGIETIGLRFLSIYGPNEESKGSYANLATQFLQAMMRNEQPVIYGDGTQTRDFTYVKDVVQAIILALESSKKLYGEVFNVGSGASHSLNEMVRVINQLLGKQIVPKYIENPIKDYIQSQDSDITKAKTVLGFTPQYSLQKGLQDMIPLVRLDKIRRNKIDTKG